MIEEIPQSRPAPEPNAPTESVPPPFAKKAGPESIPETIWDNIDAGYELIGKWKKLGIFTQHPSPRKAMRELAKAGGIYPIPNIAVDACVEAWTNAIKELLAKKEKGMTKDNIAVAGRTAYCACLPKLSTREDVTDFIACVAHAMALNILPGADGTRLIYAAQVSSTTFPPRKHRKKDNKNALRAQKGALKEHPVPKPTPDTTTT